MEIISPHLRAYLHSIVGVPLRIDFIALVKNYGVGFRAAFIDQFEFHGSTPFSALPRREERVVRWFAQFARGN